MTKEASRIRAIVSGVVQGVGYRAWAQRTAASLGLTGWVRNLPDGSVETVAEGDVETVERFVSLLRQGPKFAEVERIEATPEEPAGEFDDFEIRR